MAFVKKESLILVEAREITFRSKEDGSEVKKWKYTFLTKEGKLKVGYDSVGAFSGDVRTVESWDDELAKEYLWEVKEFNGETREQLYIEGLEIKAKNA